MSTFSRHADGGGGGAGNNNVLWMGDVDAAMDEPFLMQSFSDLKEPAEYVRVLRPKDGMSTSGYAFVGFRDEVTAQRVLRLYNGRPIPNSEGKRFRLNSSTRNRNGGPDDQQLLQWNQNRHNVQKAGAGLPARSPASSWPRTGQRPRMPEFTAYIGDMTADMDDEPFFDLFKSSYPSVFAARIMRMPDGTSKQFAFVRFHDEAEYREALTHETRLSVQLGCQIRICKAHPRPTQPRRWPAGQSRMFVQDSGPQLIDPSVKFQANLEHQQQRMRQASPSGQQPHSAQPFLSDQPAFYYIPVSGYPQAFADPGYWNQWQELYQHVPVPEVGAQPAFGQAVGLPEAGDTANMQPCHSFVRPGGWQMHVPLQQHPHFLPDQRFYTSGDVVDAADKHSSTKSDQFSGLKSKPELTA